jgi:outer membrane protein OmpA-like peptidoglycan-associated protein
MIRKLGMLLGCILFFAPAGFGYDFYFDQTTGDQYILETYSIQDILRNNNLIFTADQKYQAELHIVQAWEDHADYEGTYYFYMRPYQSAEPYVLQNEQTTHTEYKMKTRGEMIFENTYLFPTIRNLPRFPIKELDVGDYWEGNGYEVQDFQDWNMPSPWQIPITIQYRYDRDDFYKEQECAVLRVTYQMDENLRRPISFGTQSNRVARIIGYFDGEYYWHKEERYSVFYNADYAFLYMLENGEIWEFRGHSYGDVRKIPAVEEPEPEVPEPPQITEDRRREIHDEVTEDLQEIDPTINVEERPEGVTINLEDILFETGLAALTPEATNTLDQIAEILKKYENFDLLVEGHTDNRGNRRLNQELSENRAAAVRTYLEHKGVRPNGWETRGWNYQRPVADNDTPEGRQKNRRVEITIVTNPEAREQTE